MGNIGDAFSVSIPTVGTAGPTYATAINSILSEVMNRLSVKVPLSSLGLTADLSLAGNNLTNVTYVAFNNLSSTPGASPASRATAYNGDFWWVSPAGPVQITNGALLNAAAVGGITGDYGGANPAQFRYVAVDSRYNAYANFGSNNWAYVRGLGFDIAAGATSSVFARLLFGGASNKTYTLPAAAASTADVRPVYMDNSGNFAVGFSTPKEMSFSPYMGFVSGIGTAQSDITDTSAHVGIQTANTNAPSVYFPLPGLVVGSQLTSFKVIGFKNDTSSTSVALIRSGSASAIFSTTSTTAGTNNFTATGSAHTVLADNHYWIRVNFPAVANDTVSSVSIFFTYPA